MARRRKGRDIHGWIVVDKPAGPTSTAVVNKLRWLLQAKKAGHAGTLDPAATGLVIVAFGEATKAVNAVQDALKTYEFCVRWGTATSSDDAEGGVLDTRETRPDRTAIEGALPRFRGLIEQVPPQVSAVHVDGVRAYDLARAGDTFDLKSRPLFVEDLRLTDIPDADHAIFSMTCGKGGYVRSIARDLGQKLGCLGHVLWLRRTSSGPFTLEDAIPFAELADAERDPCHDELLRPLEDGLTDLPRCDCAPSTAKMLSNGNPVHVLTTNAEPGEAAWAAVSGTALALGRYDGGMFAPSRVLLRDLDDS
ncbi:tRNA pseudouridine(55) synthase TruB [Halovulum sp. GXIMD14793]